MERADVLLVKNGLLSSRQKAILAIKAGNVEANGKIVAKPSEKFSEDTHFLLIGDGFKYVSRGGLKLEGALKTFDVKLKDKVVLDMGASTGGFTDCALQNGAKKVFAVDVGSGQLVDELKNDPRVVSMENTDIRKVPKEIFDECDYIVGDISFISITKILSAIKDMITSQTLILLIKPQFECGMELAKKFKGVIRDYNLSKKICNDTLKVLTQMGFCVEKLADSPIKGGDGNTEFVALVKRHNASAVE